MENINVAVRVRPVDEYEQESNPWIIQQNQISINTINSKDANGAKKFHLHFIILLDFQLEPNNPSYLIIVSIKM